MVGITSYGTYVPRYRMSRKVIASAIGWFNPAFLPGEKAVANYDEDSISMAVAACTDCLPEISHDAIDGLYFATTSAPYQNREGSAIISSALALKPNIRTADLTNSTKAGTTALISACEATAHREIKNMLVCAADCRLAKPGSTQEQVFGDGAAALLIGSEGVIATLEGSFSVSYDFPDFWKSAYDKFEHTAEERFIRDEGYAKFTREAITGLLKKLKLEPKDITKVIFPCLYLRDHAAIGKKLGFNPEQVQEPLVTTMGEAGTASPLLMLSAALEEAKPGDKIVISSYGNGSEAMLFTITDEIEKKRPMKGIKRQLASRRELTSYEKYLVFRGVLPVEAGVRGEVGFTWLPLNWRERKSFLALCGSKCKQCGTPQYPPQRICINPDCGAVDEMDEYRFAEKEGTLFSYTEDSLAFSISPPQIYGVIDFDGGGRYVFDITDCDPGSLKVGTPMKMSFRRKYFDENRGLHVYYWKAIPILE